jgi:DNA-binding response OmpR family regulator
VGVGWSVAASWAGTDRTLRPAVAVFAKDPGEARGICVALAAFDPVVRTFETQMDSGRCAAAVVLASPETDPSPVISAVSASSDYGVLVIAEPQSTSRLLDIFDAGATDVACTPVTAQEVVARLTWMLRRKSAPLRIGPLEVNPATRNVTWNGQAVSCTRTEFDLLALLLERRGLVVSRDDLLLRARGSAIASASVLDVHIGNLRRKLEVHGARLIETVRGAGFVVREP